MLDNEPCVALTGVRRVRPIACFLTFSCLRPCLYPSPASHPFTTNPHKHNTHFVGRSSPFITHLRRSLPSDGTETTGTPFTGLWLANSSPGSPPSVKSPPRRTKLRRSYSDTFSKRVLPLRVNAFRLELGREWGYYRCAWDREH